MVKRIAQQKPTSAEGRTRRTDSRAPPEALGTGDAAGEVAVDDLNDLFAAAISRLAEWIVRPPAEPGVLLACVQALRQLHLTASNELLRRQQQLDGRP